jgi:2-methylisocitrate lyase-like PEP mutase family enzyme
VRIRDCDFRVCLETSADTLTLAELFGLGVKRVSVGSALYRTAIGAFMRAAQEMQENGSFSFAGHAATPHELSRIMR